MGMAAESPPGAGRVAEETRPCENPQAGSVAYVIDIEGH